MIIVVFSYVNRQNYRVSVVDLLFMIREYKHTFYYTNFIHVQMHKQQLIQQLQVTASTCGGYLRMY